MPALDELRAIDQWVCWRYVQRKEDAKPTKVPYSPTSPFLAAVDKPHTWGTYEQATAMRDRRGHDGVGLVLTRGLDLIAVDLDDCISDDGDFEPWVRGLLELGETYAEITPSGRGIRLWARGSVDSVAASKIGIEVYGSGRYLTFTGDHIDGVPADIREAPRTLEVLGERIGAWREELAAAKATAGKPAGEAPPIEPVALDGIGGESSEYFRSINAAALANLDVWVTRLFGAAARFHPGTGAWRVSSRALGRDLEEDLSIAPSGIVDFGVHDMGDPRGGKRSAIDLVIEHGGAPDAIAAAHQLADWLGRSPADFGWREPWEDDGFDPDAMAVGGSEAPSDEPPPAASCAPPPPPTMDYPPGLVGDIARWIVATSRRPQPDIAIGAALVLVGTVAGRLYQGPEAAATHLYVLGLAPTGGGKDWPLRCVARLLKLAGAEQHVGPSEFISMPAVVEFLRDKALSACCMDEFGDFMARVNHRRASGFEKSIAKLLRTLWSSGFAPYSTPQWAQKSSVTLHAPALSIFGASTPGQFYDAMIGGALEDGTMNRFLVVGREERPTRQTPKPYDPEEAMTFAERLRAIYFVRGELSASYRNDSTMNPEDVPGGVIQLPWGPGAKERYEAIENEIDEEMGDKLSADFLVRVAEQAVRVATIVALGQEKDRVDVEDLEWAYVLAAGSASFMRAGAAEYMAENEHQAALQKILRVIRECGDKDGWVHQRVIVRSIRTMKAKDIRDALGQLCEAGEIKAVKVDPPASGGHATVKYRKL